MTATIGCRTRAIGDRMSQYRPRRRFRGEELLGWYVVTGLVAIVVGLIAGVVGLALLTAFEVGCRPVGGDVPPGGELSCPDGTGRVLPALVLCGLGGLAVLVTTAALLSRRADAGTLLRISRHVLWLAATLVALPATAWILLLLGPAAAPGAAGPLVGVAVAAVVVAAMPLIASYVRPARADLILAVCTMLPVAGVLLGRWLPLLVPVALPLAALWSIALWLRRTAGQASSPTDPTAAGRAAAS